LVRVTTLAAAIGAFSGVWTIFTTYLSILPSPACGPIACATLHNAGWVVELLAAALLVVSAVCFLGPKSLFYLSAMFSGVLAGTVYALADFTAIVAVTLVLCAAALVLGVLAARREASVSEQSHPMNLPVFG